MGVFSGITGSLPDVGWRFDDLQNPVGHNVLQHLHPTAWPAHLDVSHRFHAGESEMYPALKRVLSFWGSGVLGLWGFWGSGVLELCPESLEPQNPKTPKRQAAFFSGLLNSDGFQGAP
jgi:hypothetical protein